MLSKFSSLSAYVNKFYIKKLSHQGSTNLLLLHGTAVGLFVFCLLVSSLQYFGKPIQCVQDRKDEDAVINEHVMNTFCFISSTYTVSHDTLGGDKPSVYGCEPFGNQNAVDGENIRRHSYYIWIPFVLFFQAVTFLAPYSCKRYSEDGLIEKLLVDVTEQELKIQVDKIRKVTHYFQKRLNTYQFFTFTWIFYDFLAFSTVFGNFFLTDLFLGGWFRNYGSRVIGFLRGNYEACSNIGEIAFPKLTKCNFYKYGAGGSLQNIDSLCVMAINVVNEKIYIILWFWFLILIPLSLSLLLFKIGTLIALKFLSKNTFKGLIQLPVIQQLIGIPTNRKSKQLESYMEHFGPSDWIFFSHLVSGMSCATYKEFSVTLEHLLEDTHVV